MSERDRRIELSHREIQKLEILNEVRAGGRTQLSAAHALGVTDRWIRKLLKRLSRGGAAALVHGNRGRPSPNRMPEERREQIAELYRTKYADFNLSHFADMLEERSCEGKFWQVERCPSIPSLAGRRIEIRRTLRGGWEAWLDEVRLRIKKGSPFSPVRELRAAEPSYSKRGGECIPPHFPHGSTKVESPPCTPLKEKRRR